MNYGVVITGGSAQEQLEAALEAEQAGWDGVFLWEGIYGSDPYVTMGAIAARTERIRLGTMLTPAPRRQPWKLASEMLSIDQISNGRAIVALGLGATDFPGWRQIGAETDRKLRAERLDETIDILTMLWSGKASGYAGKHFPIEEFGAGPASVQQPRIPIWVVGAWFSQKSMERVARCDGLLPHVLPPAGQSEWGADDVRSALTPDLLRQMKSWIEQRRTLTTPFDIVIEGETPGDDPVKATAQLQPFQDAGVTWWIEARWSDDRDGVLQRIRQGPPIYQNPARK